MYFLTDPQAFVSLVSEMHQGLQEKNPSRVPIFIYPKAIRHGQVGAVRAGGGPEWSGAEMSSQQGLPETMQPPLKLEHGGFYSDSLEQQKGKT